MPDGKFSKPVIGKVSLRPSKRSPRNSGYLVTSTGAVGRDGVLQALESITRLATGTFTFPYPQIFVFSTRIIVCGPTDIYEYDGSLSASLLTVTEGGYWDAVDFYDFIYLTNGAVAVKRDPDTGAYSVTTDFPICSSACDMNGQVFVSSIEGDSL